MGMAFLSWFRDVKKLILYYIVTLFLAVISVYVFIGFPPANWPAGMKEHFAIANPRVEYIILVVASAVAIILRIDFYAKSIEKKKAQAGGGI